MTGKRHGSAITLTPLAIILSLGLLAGVASASPGPARLHARQARRHHREVIGEILRVELVGGFHYTFDNAIELSNGGCGSSEEEENWSPNESHSVIGMKWKTVYPRVRILAPQFKRKARASVVADPVFKGKTRFKEHSYEAHGFFYDGDSGECRAEQSKETFSCSGKVNPGRRAQLLVDAGAGYVGFDFAVFANPEELSLAPGCRASGGDAVSRILSYYAEEDGEEEPHELMDVNSMAEVHFGAKVFDRFAAGKRKTVCSSGCKKKKAVKFPQRADSDCSVPDSPGVVINNRCTQTEDPRSIYVVVHLVKRIYD